MELRYRGVSYEYNPPKVPVSDMKEVGKYRGAELHFHQLRKSIPQPPADLKYRGVPYHKGKTA